MISGKLDLVDMQKNKSQNKNFNYILTVIDIFSKFAWAIPIKNKTGDSITRAFEIIFRIEYLQNYILIKAWNL